LIEWINSFNNEHCVITSKFEDFKDGIVLCELIQRLIGKKFKYNSSELNTFNKENIEIALNELKNYLKSKVPSFIRELSAEELNESEEALFSLLGFLKSLFKGKHRRVRGEFLEPNDTDRINSFIIPETPLENEDMNSIQSIPHKEDNVPKSDTNWHLKLHKSEIKEPTKKGNKLSDKTKERIWQWLMQQGVIKDKSITIKNLHEHCKDGMLIANLIQRLEGVIYLLSHRGKQHLRVLIRILNQRLKWF